MQVFLLFGTAMWLVGGTSTAIASSSIAPMTWTGVVHDTGPAGVFLRSEARVDPATAKDSAGPGSRLAVTCGQTGDDVRNGSIHTATWLKTTDGLFVSMLYVRVPDRQSIPSCADSTVDAPLLALADPANPDLPPPPGTSLSDNQRSGSRAATAGGAVKPNVVAAPAPAIPAAPGVQRGQVVAPPAQATASNPANTGGTPSTEDHPKDNTPPPAPNAGTGTGVGTGQGAPATQPPATPPGPVG
ncbi:hypothetical protein [Actinomycetospora sp. NBRC 106378]|uniref:hypothetical protein n=1 Tax=Actinomycetospora sp. NBRC 106378 TaxID=3032208 RepID=UPI0025540BF6|nr:hypothetical protein [Actinomycetospora sp. NBRC 106378]